MAKYQACRFLRKKPTAILKCDVPWELGIARVESFGMSDVDFIIDNQGKKVGKLWRYELISGLAYCAIDTEAV